MSSLFISSRLKQRNQNLYKVNDVVVLQIDFPRICMKAGEVASIDRILGEDIYEISVYCNKGKRRIGLVVVGEWLKPEKGTIK